MDISGDLGPSRSHYLRAMTISALYADEPGVKRRQTGEMYQTEVDEPGAAQLRRVLAVVSREEPAVLQQRRAWMVGGHAAWCPLVAFAQHWVAPRRRPDQNHKSRLSS